ncbi:hypothetical protein [Streptomyces olivochromogenes]|uniref:Transcriptional regulator n=1 Tax=Streptomyces olivochromogenes TaxID=1963 RepID=A0A250VQH0_STROL|nr:hypothetical protein [Streptomyces olivochromogenes]KUN39663.1 hypothetical protein AQJ27_41845 [Streptomyces olivochromogenes]GAX56220.1 transcriptional regulator [Streptomyces olivochromogenes]
MRQTRRALAETLSRIGSLIGDGQSRDDVLDVEQLSNESGVPRDVVRMLLDGEEPPVEDITDRIVRRIVHLRETRLRPDGTRHSYDEIAASYGASRASLSNLVNSRRKTPSPQMPSRQALSPQVPSEQVPSRQTGERRPARSGGPLASTQAGIESFFFGQPNGWLSAEPQASLDNALQPVLRGLEGEADDPMARLRSTHGLRELAARAPQLAEEELQLVTDWIDTILQRRNAQQVRGSGSDSSHTEGH